MSVRHHRGPKHRLPRDHAREELQKLLDQNPQMTFFERLQNYFPRGKAQGPLFMRILHEYIPISQIRGLLFNHLTYAAAVPVLWARVDLSFDSIFDGDTGKGQLEAFFDSIEERKVNNRWYPEWVQEICIHDSRRMTEGPYVPAMSARLIHAWNWKFVVLVKEFTALRSLRWNSTVPFSAALLETLGSGFPLLKECQFIIHSSRATQFSEGMSILVGDKGVESSVPRATSSNAAPPAQRHKLSALSDIVLLEATAEHVNYLAKIIGRYFESVRDVRIFGDLSPTGRQRETDDSTPLPSRGQKELSLPPDHVQPRGTISIRRLSLIALGTAAKYIVPAVMPESLTDLKIDHCVDLRHILQPLTGKAINLGGFDVHLPDIHDYPDTERGPQKQDQMAVCNFLRSGTCQLKALQICGQFTSDKSGPGDLGEIDKDVGLGWRWRALNQKAQLFAAIQAHLPWLEQLSVIDGFHYEFTQFTVEEIKEIGRCAPRLVDFRFRATPAWPGPGREKALLSYLSTVLPYLQQVQCIGLLGNTFVPDISEFEQSYHLQTDSNGISNTFKLYQNFNFDFANYAQLIRRGVVATVAAVKAAHPSMQLRLLGYEEAASEWPPPFHKYLEAVDPSSAVIITPGKGLTPTGLWETPEFLQRRTTAAAGTSTSAVSIRSSALAVTPTPMRSIPNAPSTGYASILGTLSRFGFTRPPIRRLNFTMPTFLNMSPLHGQNSLPDTRRASVPNLLLHSGVPPAPARPASAADASIQADFSSSPPVLLEPFTTPEPTSAPAASHPTDSDAKNTVPQKRSEPRAVETSNTKKQRTQTETQPQAGTETQISARPIKPELKTPPRPNPIVAASAGLTNAQRYELLRTYLLKAQQFADENPPHEWYWIISPTPILVSSSQGQGTFAPGATTNTPSSSIFYTPQSKTNTSAYSPEYTHQQTPSRTTVSFKTPPPNSAPDHPYGVTPSTIRSITSGTTTTSSMGTVIPVIITRDILADQTGSFQNGSQGIRLLAHIRGGADVALSAGFSSPSPRNSSTGPSSTSTPGKSTPGSGVSSVRRAAKPVRNTRGNRNVKTEAENDSAGRGGEAVATGSGNGWLFHDHLRQYAIMLGIKQRGVRVKKRRRQTRTQRV